MIATSRSEGSKDGPTKETATPFELILYWFSHGTFERFLSIKPCLFLYRLYIGETAQWAKSYVEAKNKRPLTL
jgi:hypothetical protein